MTDEIARASRPGFSIPSILSIIAAFISLKLGFLSGLILAVVAILLGIFGMILAMSPRTRGGIISIIGVVGGLIGIVAALFRLLSGNVL